MCRHNPGSSLQLAAFYARVIHRSASENDQIQGLMSEQSANVQRKTVAQDNLNKLQESVDIKKPGVAQYFCTVLYVVLLLIEFLYICLSFCVIG